MAMLQIVCKDCGAEESLRGWIAKEDLLGTEYEELMDTITDEELQSLEKAGKIQDEWDKWDGKCPVCGSKNVITF
ncbi:MAG: hypothetical protein ACLTG6_07860 [Roseburia faecis]|jgi:DNA-directed RNA polymerase subunit M/transcription elongation factor TFIIS|nr:MAG: hypothetical protein BHV89_09340 [Clostridiales bacterium 41_21_two_genomes]